MQNNDWIKAGEDILHSVVDAVEQQDFSGLSKEIESKVNQTLGYVGEKLSENAKKYSNGQEQGSKPYVGRENVTQEWINARKEQLRASKEEIRAQKEHMRGGQYAAGRESQLPALYQKNPPGTYSGITFQVLGIVGTSLFGIAVLILTVLGLFTGAFGIWLADLIVSSLMAGSAVMLSWGVKIKGRIRRFQSYVKQVGSKQYCKIEELARTVGKSKRFVEKELRQMISDNFFLQGHLDHSGSTLITSNEVYQHYLETEKTRQIRELEESRQARIKAEAVMYPEQVQQILEEGERYVQHIHACNDAIPGEVMSGKLETLENIMKRIFEQLKKSPESSDDLQKLMKYYLPTTSKLLDAYIELDGKPSYGSKNIETTKKEIEDTLDVINKAFSKLFDDMFEETAWDISADISTMKTMLAKEGLTGERDFQI